MDNKEVINIIPSKDISFRTRSLLSQILSRLELTNQDRLDLEKYITFGGGENLDYIKDNLEIFIEYKDKILNIIKDAPEEFDSLIEIFNHIEQHIQDAPFKKGNVKNSAVLKGGNNQVISEGGVALGKDNFVGLKGWYYSSINKINDTTIDVYISDSQRGAPTWGGTTKFSNINPLEVLGYYTVVSLVNDAKYDNKFKVIGGEAGIIRLQTVSGTLPFNSIATEFLLDPEDYSIYCLSKPDIGVADIGQGSVAGGYNNNATNGKATAFGFNNHAYGKFSFAEGRGNKAGYAAHAEGRETSASGNQSHAEGGQTSASGNCSHAEGRNTTASGNQSHAEGESTKAIGLRSHAEGYNTNASGPHSHAEGEGKTEGGSGSLLVGAHGRSSHVEGIATTTGEYDEQNETWSKGDAAHAEGNLTTASGNHSHAEGSGTKASGWQAHSEGHNTLAKGNRSHAEGSGTEALNLGEHAQGSFNKSTESTDKSKATLFSIGIGTSATDRKNAVEVKQNGDTYLCIGGTLYFVTPITDDELNELFND